MYDASLPQVFCTEKLHQEALDFLEGKVILTNRFNGRLDPAEDLEDHIGDSEGLINIGYTIDQAFLKRAPRLRVVSNISVGYNNLNIPDLKKRGVIATHTPGVMNESVAELIIGHMIAASRRSMELDRAVRRGEWTNDTFLSWMGMDVTRAKLGIIGCGRIGLTLARKVMRGFDMQVSYYNINRNEQAERELGMRYEEKDELLKTADFVVLLIPLIPSTRHMFGKKEFALMKKTSVFINAARGPLVNEPDLIEALKTSQIRAAGLDVFEQEPTNPFNELLELENTVLTPHIGSSTFLTRNKMIMLACKEMVAALCGGEPECIVPELR